MIWSSHLRFVKYAYQLRAVSSLLLRLAIKEYLPLPIFLQRSVCLERIWPRLKTVSSALSEMIAYPLPSRKTVVEGALIPAFRSVVMQLNAVALASCGMQS